MNIEFILRLFEKGMDSMLIKGDLKDSGVLNVVLAAVTLVLVPQNSLVPKVREGIARELDRSHRRLHQNGESENGKDRILVLGQ